MKSILPKNEIEQFIVTGLFSLLVALIRLVMLRVKRITRLLTRRVNKEIKEEQKYVSKSKEEEEATSTEQPTSK